MTQQHVEVVHSMVEAVNRRDLQAFSALFAPDAEITPLRAALDGTIFRGEDAPAAFFAAIDEIWRDIEIRITDVRDLGEVILASGAFHGLGSGSGVTVEAVFTMVVQFADGLAVKAGTYSDRGDALKAAGLAE